MHATIRRVVARPVLLSTVIVVILLLAAACTALPAASTAGPQTYVLGVAQPFHGRHLVPIGLRAEDEARADEPAVEEHRAGAALALLAGVLRARQPEPFAQDEQQALARPDLGLLALTVDGQLDPHAARQRSMARAASTRRAWRR